MYTLTLLIVATLQEEKLDQILNKLKDSNAKVREQAEKELIDFVNDDKKAELIEEKVRSFALDLKIGAHVLRTFEAKQYGQILFVNKQGDVCITYANGYCIKQLTQHERHIFPVFTQDGKGILSFSYKEDQIDIFRYDLEHKHLTKKGTIKGHILSEHARWSPDRTKLAFPLLIDAVYKKTDTESSITGTCWDIHIFDFEKKELIRLTKGGAVAPCWSFDGTKILFQTASHERTEISIIDIRTKSIKQLTSSTGITSNFKPVFSLDGKKIAYTTRKDEKITELWIMDIDGSNKKRILKEDSIYVGHLVFLDDARIAISLLKNGEPHIYIVEQSKPDEKKLICQCDDQSSFCFSQDSECICLVRQGNLYMRELSANVEFCLGEGKHPLWIKSQIALPIPRDQLPPVYKSIKDLDKLLNKQVAIEGKFITTKGYMGVINGVLIPEFANDEVRAKKYEGKKVRVTGILLAPEKMPENTQEQYWLGPSLNPVSSIEIIE